MPEADNGENWRRRTHREGVSLAAVKASRYITHVKKLRSPRESLERFYDVVDRFEHKLGPILFQLPPMLKFDAAVFDEFCAALKPGRRHALEVRHPDWIRPDALQSFEAAASRSASGHTCGRFPYAEAGEGRFRVYPLHGPQALYGSIHEEELRAGRKKSANGSGH